jgi:hypothetical protein
VQVTPAIATSDATSARTLGWLSAAIANNASGLCQIEGYLEGLNTQSLNAGDQLYLSGTVAGAFTATKPQAPIHLVYVGVVTKVSAGDGHVFVKVQNGYELEELHDVKITSPANNDVLTYDLATDLWINKVNAADGVTSITATAPLTGGTITSTGSIGLDQTALNIAQSQVTNLVTDLANTAKTNANNTFANTNAFNAGSTFNNFLSINSADGNGAGSIFTTGEAGGLNKILIAGSRGNGGVIIGSSAAVLDTTVLAVRGATTQNGNLTEWRTIAGTILANISNTGTISTAANINATGQARVGTGTSLGQLSVVSASSGTIGAVIRGAASQTGNLLEIQSSAGSILSRFESTGNLVVPGTTGAISSGTFIIGSRNSGAELTMVRQTAATSNPGANLARIYFRDGTVPGTLKLVVRAGAAGAETTILDNIPQ